MSVHLIFSKVILVVGALTAIHLCSNALAAPASVYPERPVRVVVGFPPGGTSDTFARIIAPKLSEVLRRPWIIDNRAGAAGNIATEIVANASPDGHTILLVQGFSLTVSPTLYKLSFSVERDLQPVILMALAQYMLVTHPSVKASTIKEFIEYAKTQPGKLNYGSAGIGGPHHLSAELFNARAGITMSHIPYKGGGPASLAVLGNEVQVLFGSLPSLLPHVRTRRIKALGVTGPARSAAAPDIPTIAESGFPGFDVTSWFGLLVPAHTPERIVKTLVSTTSKVLRMQDVREAIAREGLEIKTKETNQFAAHIKAETAVWATVIKNAHIRVE